MPPRPAMTRAVETARDTRPSSSDGETSQDSSGDPHTPTTHSIVIMHLLHKKSVDVANDLDLFVYDSSDYELSSEAGFNSLRGRARDRPKRSRSFPKSTEVVAKLMQPPSRRGRSTGPKANLLRKAKGEAEIEAQRQQDAQDDYDTADFITVPPLYLTRKDRWTLLPDRQDLSSYPTSVLIPGTQTLPSILRSPGNNTIDKSVEPVPRLTFARRPSSTEGSDTLSPSSTHFSSVRTSAAPLPPRGTGRLSFAIDAAKQGKTRRRSTTKISDEASISEVANAHEQMPRRPSNFSVASNDPVLRSPTSSISSYTSTTPPTLRRTSASASSTSPLSINTLRKSKSSSVDRPRSNSSSSSAAFLLPFAGKTTSQSEGSSAGASPTRSLASAAPTVKLCKVCATYHQPTIKSDVEEGEAEEGSVASTEAESWRVAANATTRRRSVPELLLYASGGKGRSAEGEMVIPRIASSTKIGSVRGRSTGRARSESDTRALLWSIQASAERIL